MAETFEELSDESLMERIQQRDHRAFSHLVERRNGMFYAAAYRMVMNKEEAEDIVQEAFLRLWSKPKSWKTGKGAKFTTWFYRIVMNISIDYMRKSAKQVSEPVEEVVSEAMTQEQNVIEEQEQKALDGALKNLPEKQLMALNLCFYEGLSNKEAANIMDVNVKALESLLMRAKASIKNNLYREGILEQGEVA